MPDTRLDARVHVFPLSDNAIGAVTGLNDIGVHKARPSCLDFVVGIEKLVIAPRLHSKTHSIGSGHRASPIICVPEVRSLHAVAQYNSGSLRGQQETFQEGLCGDQGRAMPTTAQLRYWVLTILANSSRNCGLSS